MNLDPTVFAQLMAYVDRREFRQIVRTRDTGHRKYHFSCWEQFLCMAFAITGKDHTSHG